MVTIMKHIFINDYRRNSYTKRIIDKTEDIYSLNDLQKVVDTETPESLLKVQYMNSIIATSITELFLSNRITKMVHNHNLS